MDDTALNERIRHLRKDVLDMSQRQFADALGMAQTSISALESPGGGVSERFIKTVCTMFNVSENWLRTGEGPIYNEGEAFSLDRWAKEHGATELELEIVKVYFELDPAIRRAVLDHFRAHFAVDPDEAEAEALKQEYLQQKRAAAESSASDGDAGAESAG